MRRHYNQVDAQSGSRLENLDCGIAPHYEDFIPVSDLQFLTADPLKFSFRRSFCHAGCPRRFRCQREIYDVKQIQSRLVLLRKLLRNGNRRERVLVEVHGAQNVSKSKHLYLL